MVHRMTTSDNEWQRMATKNNEGQSVVQLVTTRNNEWQRVTTSGTTSGNDDNGCQRVVQQMKTNESEYEQVKENDFGFRIKQYCNV